MSNAKSTWAQLPGNKVDDLLAFMEPKAFTGPTLAWLSHRDKARLLLWALDVLCTDEASLAQLPDLAEQYRQKGSRHPRATNPTTNPNTAQHFHLNSSGNWHLVICHVCRLSCFKDWNWSQHIDWSHDFGYFTILAVQDHGNMIFHASSGTLFAPPVPVDNDTWQIEHNWQEASSVLTNGVMSCNLLSYMRNIST